MTTLADRIQRILDATGMPKSTLAQRAGVSPGAVTQWLTGDTQKLAAEVALAISDATGFSIRWLISGKGPEREMETETERELIDRYRAADETGRRVIDRVAEEFSPYPRPGGGESDGPAKLRMRA